jgi:arabinosaccharide transport system substrate-binding protein
MRDDLVQPDWRTRLESLADWFPFGKAPLVILMLLAVSGAWHLARPIGWREATLRLWTFAHPHLEAYLNAQPSFEAAHPGTTLDIQLVHMQAVTSRLRAAFWADLDVPDLVEVEITPAGTFFAGPPDKIGFEDLTPHLKASGLMDRLVQTRLAPYTHRGRIYGLPHDVHPVMLAYRRDLFEELGLRAEDLDTWEKFVAAGRRVTRLGERYMIALPDAASYGIETLLFQRDGLQGRRAGFFDPDGDLIMDNETAVETVKWYVPLVAGADRIAAEPGWGQPWVQSVEDGYILSFICPDWRSNSAEKNIPRMAGKMALMPLPAVVPGGRRTSTWGGTMLAITKRSPHKALAWELAQHLYLNPDELALRFRDTNILPALRTAWDHEAIHDRRPYWSGQRIGELFRDLADQVPPQYGHPYLNLAKSKLGEVVGDCAAYYEAHGDGEFDAYVRRRLKAAADEVRTQMKRNPF